MLDAELRTARDKPVSLKVCLEKIDQYANEARGILSNCGKDERGPTPQEQLRFDELTDVLIPAWQAEKGFANQWKESVIADSQSRLAEILK